MRAASLLLVLVLAKVLVLVGRSAPVSAWAPVAYFWQDVLVAAAVGTLDVIFRRPRLAWGGYALLVAYVAINVPIALVLASSLTWPMIHAARGPLVDSIAHYLTVAAMGSVALVAVAGGIVPLLLARSGRRVPVPAMLLAVACVAAGPWSERHVDTAGLERNAVTALLPRAVPHGDRSTPSAKWRDSPFGAGPSNDLSAYRNAASGRNVVVVVLESTAARYLRAYGAAADPMPHLTALAEHALLFENAYAVYPESIKGLFATLCSRYPAFGVAAEAHAAVPCASIAQLLASAGYRTALFHSGRFAYLGMDEIIQRKGFDVLEDAGAIGGHIRSSFGVDEPATVHRMLGWVDALKPGQRFLLTYLPVAGHHPYVTPTAGPFPATTEADQYLNALHYSDESLGALLDGLRARRLYDNTVVVVFGDHGEAFDQHPGNNGHTFFIYDENVRVPYLVSIPGVTEQQVRVPALASLLDTAPTILDLLGLPSSAGHQGTSLLQPGSRMALFYTDYSLGWLGLRDGCLKYLFEIDSGRSKLFDVCRDPNEMVDLSAAEADRVTRYRDRVEQWSATQRAAVIAGR